MPRDAKWMQAIAGRVRKAWFGLSGWAPDEPGEPPRVQMGRRPIRPAIRPLEDFEAEDLCHS